jgi:histidinol-phosphatase (PHP family)
MAKFRTDLHTHSAFSHDGRNSLEEMLQTASERGLCFYGVNEHYDGGYKLEFFPERLQEVLKREQSVRDEYFHHARHLQDDYAGVLNVLVGIEFGYDDDENVLKKYVEFCQKHQPDYVINSVHGVDGKDYCYCAFEKDKKSEYDAYLELVKRSLDAPYPYDVVGHFRYIARYVPFEDKSFAGFEKEIDDILLTIIQKGKILEVNTAVKGLKQATLPSEDILKRYFELGGRKVSFGSDAHNTERIADGRESAAELLKTIGFTHITVPFKGEHIKVEL